MMKPALLERLRCPLTKGELRLASDQEIAAVNRQISQRQARDHVDCVVELPIDGGLISEQAGRIYPVRQKIPSLVIEESIALDIEALQTAN